MSAELVLVIGLFMMIALSELREWREAKRAERIERMLKAVTASHRSAAATIEHAQKQHSDALMSHLQAITQEQKDQDKRSRELITDVKAKIEHLVHNFEIKTRLADEHNQHFDTIEM